MTIQWQYNDNTMTIQWRYNDDTMTIQWQYNDNTMTIKENGQKDKQWSTKHYRETKYLTSGTLHREWTRVVRNGKPVLLH